MASVLLSRTLTRTEQSLLATQYTARISRIQKLSGGRKSNYVSIITDKNATVPLWSVFILQVLLSFFADRRARSLLSLHTTGTLMTIVKLPLYETIWIVYSLSAFTCLAPVALSSSTLVWDAGNLGAGQVRSPN